MSEFSQEEISKLMKLCRIKCTEQEETVLASNLSKILSYIELLQEVDTSNVAPCIHVTEQLTNVFREDKTGYLLSRDEFLSNAPAQIGGMVRVPPIIKSSN